MAQKATSFVVDLKNETDKSAKREIPLKSGKSVIGAVRAKYCADQDGLAFGHITVFTGKPRKKSNSEDAAELEYLTNVCLSNSNIRRSGLEDQSITSLCPNVVDLDLSGNKLESWKEILPVMQQLNSLKFINIARNMITKDKDVLHNWTTTLSSLENLVLNQTGARWQEILHLAKLLPHLKELHICGNNYTEIPAGRHHGLHSVVCLRMNNNQLTNWDQVWKLRYLPNLKSLILSGNPLLDIFYRGDDPEWTCTCHTDTGTDTGNDVTNSNNVDNTVQVEEVRQYCENILNAVIDDVIRNDVVNGTEIFIDDVQGSETEKTEKDQNEIPEEAGFQNIKDGNKNETIETHTDSISVINDDLEPKDIEQFSREIVEAVLQRAIEFVKYSNNMETEAEKDTDILKDDDQNNLNNYSENNDFEKQNSDSLNDEKDRPVKAEVTEESAKGQHSCCFCEEAPTCDTPFNSLETLCLSETQLGKWKHLSALRGFPALKSVRIKNVKLGSKLNDEDKRKLFMASLPNIKLLNGSEVTQSEREKSERHLLRHFCEKKQKPDIYHILEQKHGKLTPLTDIDISKGYTDYVTLSFVYKGREAFSETVCVREQFGSLRKLIASKLSRKAGLYSTLYHKHCNSRHDDTMGELQEIRSDLLPMSRLDFLDGDEIHIDDATQFGGHSVRFYLNKPKK